MASASKYAPRAVPDAAPAAKRAPPAARGEEAASLQIVIPCDCRKVYTVTCATTDAVKRAVEAVSAPLAKHKGVPLVVLAHNNFERHAIATLLSLLPSSVGQERRPCVVPGAAVDLVVYVNSAQRFEEMAVLFHGGGEAPKAAAVEGEHLTSWTRVAPVDGGLRALILSMHTEEGPFSRVCVVSDQRFFSSEAKPLDLYCPTVWLSPDIAYEKEEDAMRVLDAEDDSVDLANDDNAAEISFVCLSQPEC